MLTNDYFEFQTFADRAGWLEGRRTLGIGSSDAAAILGVSRFMSPLQLFYEKRGERIESADVGKVREELRAWGHILEEPIAQRYSAEVGRFVVAPPAHSVAVSKTIPFAIASVDRFINGTREGGKLPPNGKLTPGVLEIKNAHFFVSEMWSEENNNEPPVEYQIQAQHQMMVTGCQWGSIAALIGGSKFVYADIPRDEEMIALLKAREAEFWQRVLDNRPPEADGSESARETLRKIYPRETSVDTIALPPEALEWAERLEEAKERESLAKADIAAYGNKLRQAIGEASAGVLSNGTVYTYKAQNRAGYVVEPGSSRVLRRKGAKS
jgi:putative phage-type endonuclease